MAMYGPRRLTLDAPARFPGDRSKIEGAPTSRSRGAARSAAARDKASRPLTSSASRYGRSAESRTGSPVPVPSAGIEDLCERILVELRLQRGPASAIARERLIRLVSNYIGAHTQLFTKAADAGDDDLGNADESGALGASSLVQDLYAEISSLQVQLAEAQARTAEERSKLARAVLKVKQAEDNTRIAQERNFKAELRLHKIEARIRGETTAEFELKFIESPADSDEFHDLDDTKAKSLKPRPPKSRSPTPQGRRPAVSSEGEREVTPRKAPKARSKTKAVAKASKKTEQDREAAALKIQSFQRGQQGRGVAKKAREVKSVEMEEKKSAGSDSSDTPRLDLEQEFSADKEAQLKAEEGKLSRLKKDMATKRASLIDTSKQQEDKRKKYEESLAEIKRKEAEEKALLERQMKEEMEAMKGADEQEKKNIKRKYKADMKKQQEQFKQLREREEQEKKMQKEKYELEFQRLQTEEQSQRERLARQYKDEEEKAEREKQKLQTQLDSLEREAKKKAKAEEQLRRQLEEENQKALDLERALAAEKMQHDEERKKREEMEKLECQRFEQNNKQKIEKMKAENAKRIEELQTKTVERNEAAAAKFADQKRQEIFHILMLSAFNSLSQHRTDNKTERKQAQMDKEMQELQKQYEEKQAFSANRMADKHYQKLCEALLKDVFYIWKDDWFTVKQSRREEQFKKELQEMQTSERALGGIHSEMMAEKMKQKLEHAKKLRIVVDWSALTIAEVAERKQKQVQEELEALKAEQREKGDHTAELMADQAYHVRQQKLMQHCWNAWQQERLLASASKKQAELEKQLEQAAFKERQRGDAAAEKAADAFARKKVEELQRALWMEWRQDYLTGKFERSQKKQAEELEKLKKMCGDNTRDRAEDAEVLAEKFRKKIEEELKHMCMGNWFKTAHKEKVEREALHLKQGYQNEILELKKKERERGDATAEAMADRFNKKRIQGWAQRCLAKWGQDIRDEQAIRQQKKQKQEYEEQMAKLKAVERAKGDKTAQALADNHRRKLERVLIDEVLDGWHMEAMEAKADKEKEAQRQKMQEEINRLRKQDREKGDERAHQIAEHNVKKRNFDLMVECFKSWYIDIKETVAARKADKVEQELDDLKNRTRRKGDATANALATKFHQKICLEMMQACMVPWSKLAMQSANEREKERAKMQMKTEIAELRKKDREKGDKTARQMADNYYKKHWDAVMLNLVQIWFQDTKAVIAQRQQTRLQQEYDDQIAALRAKDRQKGDEHAEQMSRQFFKRIQDDMMRVALQLLRENSLAERSEREKYEIQMKYEDDVKKLKEQDAENLVAQSERMAERFYKKNCEALMLKLLGEWHRQTAVGAELRKAAKERQKYDEELERLKHMEREKGDLTAERIADQSQKVHRHDLMGGVLHQWQKQAIHGRAARERERYVKQYNKKMEELQALHEEQGEIGGAIAEQMAETFKRKGDEAVTHQIMSLWHHYTTNEKAVKKQQELERDYEQKMQDLVAKTRQRGDETAELMAENFRRKHWNERVRRCLTTWRTAQLQAEAERNEAEVKRQMQEELDKMRLEARQAGDEKAEQMADRFNKQHCIHLVHAVMQAWCNFVKEELFHKVQLEMRQEHEQQIAAGKQREEQHAQTIGEVIYRSRLRTLQARCLVHWAKWFHIETSELDNKNKLKKLQDANYEREARHLEEFKSKLSQLRGKLIDKFSKSEGELTKTRIFCAISFNTENSIRERFMNTNVARQEDELARLVQVQGVAKFKILAYMSGRMMVQVSRLMKQRVIIEWQYVLRLYDKIKQHTAQTMMIRQEMDEFRSKQQTQWETRLQKLEAICCPQRYRKLIRRAIYEWHDIVSSGLQAMKMEEIVIKGQAELAVYKEKIMDETAGMMGDLRAKVEDSGMMLVLQRVIWAWAGDVDMSGLMRLHKAEEERLKEEYSEHLSDLEMEKQQVKDHFADWNASEMFKTIKQLGTIMYFSAWVRSRLRVSSRHLEREREEDMEKLKKEHSHEITELAARYREEKLSVGERFLYGQQLLYNDGLCFRYLLWWRVMSMVKPVEHVQEVQVQAKETRSKGAEASVYLAERLREEVDVAEKSATIAWWLKAMLEAWAEKEVRKVKKQTESEIYRAEEKLKDIAEDQKMKLAGYIGWRATKDMVTNMLSYWKVGAEVSKVQSKLEQSTLSFRGKLRQHRCNMGLIVSDTYEYMIKESLLSVILITWFTTARQDSQAEVEGARNDKEIEMQQVQIKQLREELQVSVERSAIIFEGVEYCVHSLFEARIVIKAMVCWMHWRNFHAIHKMQKAQDKVVNQTEQRLEARFEDKLRQKTKDRISSLEHAAVLVYQTRQKLLYIRVLVVWQRWISRSKSDAEIMELKFEAQTGSTQIREQLQQDIEAIKSRAKSSSRSLVDKLEGARHDLLVTNTYRVWQRQWVIAEMDGEQRSVVKDLEEQLANALRAKKLAESKAQMAGTLFSLEAASVKDAKVNAAKAKAELVRKKTETELVTAALDEERARMKAVKAGLPTVKEEMDAETAEQFWAIRKSRIEQALMKIFKRRLAIAMLKMMEFEGLRSQNPPGFQESFEYARDQAQKKKQNALQAAATAEKSLAEAITREKEALRKIDILEEENQERERQLTVLKKELSAAREKLTMTARASARGDVPTWAPVAGPPAKGYGDDDNDSSPDPTGRAVPLQSAPPPKSPAAPAAGPARPGPTPPAPTRPTGRSDSTKRVSFSTDKTSSGRGAAEPASIDGSGVGATLDRLARARQAISGPAVDPDEDDFSWPAGTDAMPPPGRPFGGLDLGGPLGSAPSPTLRAPRATVAEQAQLAAQLSELQLYMGRFEASHK